MRKQYIGTGLLLVAVLFGFIYSSGKSPDQIDVQRIVIIRHGEKPEKGDNLSCQGLNRSLQLPGVLNSKFGMPSAIYVPSIHEGKTTGVARMYQTIVPFAVKYNLAINSKYDVGDAEGLVKAIQKQHGTVLLVWEHKAIHDIMKALGLSGSDTKWDDNDFDSIWIITYNNGKPVLTKDKENIHPFAACP